MHSANTIARRVAAEEAGATTEVRTPIGEYSGVELIDELRRKWPKHKNSPQSED